LSLRTTSGNPAPGATITLKKSTGEPVGSAVSDDDGFYQISYKHTGKAALFKVTIVLGSFTQTQEVTLKANAFFQVDFDVPGQ
jgi:5-hydroxyisourate hydrolase-like protein (transthyretin family)